MQRSEPGAREGARPAWPRPARPSAARAAAAGRTAEHGELQAKLAELAAKTYQHPTTGEPVRYSLSTIERWFYAAKDAPDPVAVLARKIPSHAGSFPAMPARLAAALEIQWREHPGWTMQLHADNLRALVREDPSLGPMPARTKGDARQ